MEAYTVIQHAALMWRPGAVLIKTPTMPAERPCRNGGFEESVNAPFGGGGPEITANGTISHSEASFFSSLPLPLQRVGGGG